MVWVVVQTVAKAGLLSHTQQYESDSLIFEKWSLVSFSNLEFFAFLIIILNWFILLNRASFKLDIFVSTC
jgi:hypothetical protein